MLNVVDLSSTLEQSSNVNRTYYGIILFGALASLLLLWGINGNSSTLLILIGGISFVVAVIFGLHQVSRHDDWLVLPLILLFLLIQISLLSEAERALLHYVVLALFCVPVVPRVWHSKVFRNGGFRLYSLYFLWAGVTVFYSITRVYSAARLTQSILLLFAVTACVLTVESADDARRLIVRFLAGCATMLAALAVSIVAMPRSITWQTPEESFTPDVLAQMAQKGINISGLDRFRGLLDDPNQIGSLMLLAVGSAAICWFGGSRRERLMLALIVLASATFAFMADSRSPFVALAIGCWLFAAWKWGARGFFGVALGVGAGAIAILHLYPGVLAYTGRDVGSLTGRTDLWPFIVERIRERPIVGYGFGVSGEVFLSRDFPIWWGPWDLGPHSSLHDGYLDHAIGVGIPATLLWLFIVMRPWMSLFRRPTDPWNLKPMFFLVVVPILICNLTETLLGDFGGSDALLFGLVWAIGERYRLFASEQAEAERTEALARLPGAAAAVMGLR